MTSSVGGHGGDEQVACPVCAGVTTALPDVDFSKSCEERNGVRLDTVQVPITYRLCGRCGFCFVPAMHRWSHAEFATHVYNDAYVEVDPDYLEVRPRHNANMLHDAFGRFRGRIRHLDFGGGSGLLSDLLGERGWNSTSYDPFLEPGRDVASLGRFHLVTAFEVFEHVPDVDALILALGRLTDRKGIVLFSTVTCDGHIKLDEPPSWWYAAPRNGHISLFSRRSLELLGRRAAFRFSSLDSPLHVYWREVPGWAGEVLGLPKGR